MPTLKQLSTRAVVSSVNLSEVPVRTIMKRYPDFQQGLKVRERRPEHDALWFYMMNHAVAIVRQRVGMDAPLDKYERIVTTYYDDMQTPALRMFFYLLIICVREVRHCPMDNPVIKRNSDPQKRLVNLFIKDIHSSECTSAIGRFKKRPPNVSLGVFCDQLCDIFFQTCWSKAYGGQSWGQVASCLRDFIYGRISAEVLLDTAWTLAHNGGPIFNKGELYTLFTNLERILDIQASGQIPQFVGSMGESTTAELKQLHGTIQDVIGEEFGGEVDTHKVGHSGYMTELNKSYSVANEDHYEDGCEAEDCPICAEEESEITAGPDMLGIASHHTPPDSATNFEYAHQQYVTKGPRNEQA